MKVLFDRCMSRITEVTRNGSNWSSPAGNFAMLVLVMPLMVIWRLAIAAYDLSVSGVNFTYHKISEKLSK